MWAGFSYSLLNMIDKAKADMYRMKQARYDKYPDKTAGESTRTDRQKISA